jgi:hypothetical protein
MRPGESFFKKMQRNQISQMLMTPDEPKNVVFLGRASSNASFSARPNVSFSARKKKDGQREYGAVIPLLSKGCAELAPWTAHC